MVTKKQLEQAEKEFHKARVAFQDLELQYRAEKMLPTMASKIGQCFRYQNCYSCPEGPQDYWWMFSKVVGIEDGCFKLAYIQRDKYGKIFIAKEICNATDQGELSESYQPMPAAAWRDAVEDILREATMTLELF